MRKFLKILMLCLAPATLAVDVAQAQDYVAIGDRGERRTIDKHGICRVVRNNNTTDVLVPLRAPTEWGLGTAAFLAAGRPGTQVTACPSWDPAKTAYFAGSRFDAGGNEIWQTSRYTSLPVAERNLLRQAGWFGVSELDTNPDQQFRHCNVVDSNGVSVVTRERPTSTTSTRYIDGRARGLAVPTRSITFPYAGYSGIVQVRTISVSEADPESWISSRGWSVFIPSGASKCFMTVLWEKALPDASVGRLVYRSTNTFGSGEAWLFKE